MRSTKRRKKRESANLDVLVWIYLTLGRIDWDPGVALYQMAPKILRIAKLAIPVWAHSSALSTYKQSVIKRTMTMTLRWRLISEKTFQTSSMVKARRAPRATEAAEVSLGGHAHFRSKITVKRIIFPTMLYSRARRSTRSIKSRWSPRQALPQEAVVWPRRRRVRRRKTTKDRRAQRLLLALLKLRTSRIGQARSWKKKSLIYRKPRNEESLSMITNYSKSSLHLYSARKTITTRPNSLAK